MSSKVVLIVIHEQKSQFGARKASNLCLVVLLEHVRILFGSIPSLGWRDPSRSVRFFLLNYFDGIEDSFITQRVYIYDTFSDFICLSKEGGTKIIIFLA